MRVLSLAALAMGVAISSAPALAQQIDDPEARINERYLAQGTTVAAVVAVAGSPVWWTVSFGEARVHILGVPRTVPTDLAWRQGGLQQRLEQTNRVLLPPMLDVRGSDAGSNRDLPDVGPIPADLAPRIEAAARGLGHPPSRYLGQHPMVAGYQLATDFRQAAGLGDERVMRDVLTVVAEQDREPLVSDSGRLVVASSRQTFNGMTAHGARACLEAVLAEVEAGDATTREAAQGWRNGQVRRALQAPRSLDICSLAAPGAADLRRESIRMSADSIASLLRDTSMRIGGIRRRNITTSQQNRQLVRQNDQVVIAYLRPLLAEDGVLDRLTAQGFKVTSSAEAPAQTSQR